MLKIVAILALVASMLSAPSFVFAGNCDHSWQQAKDGSSCGGRAADQREGGKFG